MLNLTSVPQFHQLLGGKLTYFYEKYAGKYFLKEATKHSIQLDV